jgi:hypothetical protein
MITLPVFDDIAEDVYHKEQRETKRIVDHEGLSHERPSARDVREL